MWKVALIDDHILLRKGLASLVNSFSDFTIILEANNGADLTEKIDSLNLPDIMLLDISMPQMNGYDTAEWMRDTYPQVKILALSMMDSENAIMRMIKNGARGYVLKDSDPSELKSALLSVLIKGYYYSDLVTGSLIFGVNKLGDNKKAHLNKTDLTNREMEFLKLACSDLTYKQIASQMFVSERTVDGYRDSLFEKFNVQSRVGMVLEALRREIVEL
jgi:two-component system invasion response regulator UvrY